MPAQVHTNSLSPSAHAHPRPSPRATENEESGRAPGFPPALRVPAAPSRAAGGPGPPGHVARSRPGRRDPRGQPPGRPGPARGPPAPRFPAVPAPASRGSPASTVRPRPGPPGATAAAPASPTSPRGTTISSGGPRPAAAPTPPRCPGCPPPPRRQPTKGPVRPWARPGGLSPARRWTGRLPPSSLGTGPREPGTQGLASRSQVSRRGRAPGPRGLLPASQPARPLPRPRAPASDAHSPRGLTLARVRLAQGSARGPEQRRRARLGQRARFISYKTVKLTSKLL